MKKVISILLCALLLLSFAACQDSNTQDGGMTKLSFKQALSYDYLQSLHNKQVIINGYLATSSPVDGSFIFLMNMPFQSCPFCVPNTNQLSNTMEVYPKDGKTFSYTNQAVKVVGTLVVAPGDEPFTDLYGYQFSFKIVDATYTILKDEDMSAEIKLWQKFSATDLINEINKMYNYVNFLCAWNTYFVNSYTNENGEKVTGYYLWASDALNYIQMDGGQYNYGYKEGYFDNIVADIEALDKTAFSDLVQNIWEAKALAQDALAELEAGNYTYEYKYVEKFGTEDYIFTIDKGEELQQRMSDLYGAFSAWLGGWEL